MEEAGVCVDAWVCVCCVSLVWLWGVDDVPASPTGDDVAPVASPAWATLPEEAAAETARLMSKILSASNQVACVRARRRARRDSTRI